MIWFRGLLPYRCSVCKQEGKWRGKPLTLQLHHKDGDSTNNSLKNLCFLCPNCHSQTSTYTGRNMKKESRCVGGEP